MGLCLLACARMPKSLYIVVGELSGDAHGAGRVHGQLGRSHVDRGDAELGGGQRSDGRAAGQIGAVHEPLDGGDEGEDEHDPEGGHQELVEQEAEPEDDEALGDGGPNLINTKDATTGDTALHLVTARRDELFAALKDDVLDAGVPDSDPNNPTPAAGLTSYGRVSGVGSHVFDQSVMDNVVVRVLDPSSVVWDEIAAFWLVLWLVTPAGLWAQFAAFCLFRFFDAVKPGPVGWADALFHGVDARTDPFAWRKAGFGIMLDDVVAAACALFAIAAWRFFQ